MASWSSIFPVKFDFAHNQSVVTSNVDFVDTVTSVTMSALFVRM